MSVLAPEKTESMVCGITFKTPLVVLNDTHSIKYTFIEDERRQVDLIKHNYVRPEYRKGIFKHMGVKGSIVFLTMVSFSILHWMFLVKGDNSFNVSMLISFLCMACATYAIAKPKEIRDYEMSVKWDVRLTAVFKTLRLRGCNNNLTIDKFLPFQFFRYDIPYLILSKLGCEDTIGMIRFTSLLENELDNMSDFKLTGDANELISRVLEVLDNASKPVTKKIINIQTLN